MSDSRPDLTPADAAVALRSLPRRFREAIARAARSDSTADADPTTDEVETSAARFGNDGTSPLEQLSAASAEIGLLHQAAAAVLADSTAPLHPAVLDRTARIWEIPPGLTVEDGLTILETESTALAEMVESASAGEWAKAGIVAGGRTVTAVTLVSDAVYSAVDRLRSLG